MLKNVRLLFGKEILGAVRDRRTLFLTVLFPLIFYPLVLAVMSEFADVEQARVDTFIPSVLVLDRSGDDVFAEELSSVAHFYVYGVDSRDEGMDALQSDLGSLLMIVDKPSGGEGLGLEVTLAYDQTDQYAAIAVARVRAFFETYLKQVVSDKMVALGLEQEYADLEPPLTIVVEDVTTGESLGRMIISRLLPYFMVLAILTGAMGLGAEITAGEKERSTIATLLVSQLSRTEIVLGKFLAVLTVSLVSSLLSAVGLLIGVHFFGSGLAGSSGVVFALDLSAFGWMLVVLVPLAVILAALVIIVGSFARSQKEASTYLLPIYMVIVLVGMISMTGGMSFQGLRFLIPVANALYALQDIIVGDVGITELLYTLVSNVACGGVLIAAAVRLFKRESVLFRS